MFNKEKFGLVLSGGGAKGAYQIGAWKALVDLGFSEQIGAISGVSVGALNSVLISQRNHSLAEFIWTDLCEKCILKSKEIGVTDILSFIGTFSFVWPVKIVNSISRLIYGGIFSREGLRMLIKEHINLSLIKNYDFQTISTCCKIPSFSAERFCLNDCSDDRIIDVMCATSAVPLVFEPEIIDNSIYYDGGLTDNIPVKPLYDKGFKNILVLNISDSPLKKSQFPDANILEIRPKIELNGFLDFSKNMATKRIQQGYDEVYNHLKNYKFVQLFREFAIDEIERLLNKSIELDKNLDAYSTSANKDIEELDELLIEYKKQQIEFLN